MKKIFENFWMIFGLMLLVSVADLIGLGTIDKFGRHWDVGAGFILTFALFLWWCIRQMTKKT